MQYSVELEPILRRFSESFPALIDCASGWHPLIVRLDRDISAIDPLYVIHQIKEKFGGLRFYYSPSNPEFKIQIDKLVSTAERISYLTCEITGKPGELMKKDGWCKTLHHSFIEQGWTPIPQVRTKL